ncbi:MAG: phosphoglycerate mutase family protein [Actinomycetia bacterium]|nr:phosphoglycerate mutase family protein [Actinomycetes bacterium]
MQLLMIRHGESVNNKVFADTGAWDARVPDPALTDRGREQAARLAAAFVDGRLPKPDVLMTSLMRRAVQTAAPLADALELPLIGHLQLHEVNGVFETTRGAGRPHPGSPASDLRAESSRLVLPVGADDTGWYHSPFETEAVAWRRAQAVVDDLTASYGGTDLTAAIVTHGHFSQYVLRAFIGWPADADGGFETWFELNNTGTILIQHPALWGSRPVDVRWINRTDHLHGDLLTW